MSPSRPAETITPALLRAWPLPMPDPATSDKAERGSVLVVGGAARTPGAALLAGVAALRAGAGKLQLAVARTVAPALAVSVPEALVAPLDESADGAIEPSAAADVAELADGASAVLIGPGLADPERIERLLAELLPKLPDSVPVVLDAFALGCLGNEPSLGEPLRGRLVLTPNVAESRRLLGLDEEPSDLAAAAAEIAQRFGACVTLRGHLAAPDGRAWVDGGGGAGLGTSGSGDVLAGLVAGLLARGGDPAQSVCWGTYVHTSSGDRLAAHVGHLGFLARELLDEAPRVIAQLEV
jgi:hydroxyethylthiazole kinase-like uncharacterized protein yjeF